VDIRPAAHLPQEPKLTSRGSILVDQDSKLTLVRTHDEG
jgi:hypothetical protein